MTPERRSGISFVVPATVALASVALFPILYGAWMSLQRLILVFHEQRFVGLSNWAFLVRDGRFWSALGNTLYFVVVGVALEVVLGMAAALLLDQAIRGRGLFRAAVLVPWSVPTVVSAKLWAHLLAPGEGPLAHLSGSQVNWLGTAGLAMHAAIVVDAWKTTPFVALLLLAGLQSIPGDVYEAAAVDGAGRFRRFWSITVPLLMPTLLVTVLFRALDAFRVFDVIYVLTEGGPANTTETLSIYAYKTLMRGGDFGYGATLATATFLGVGVLAALYLRLFARTRL